MLIAGLPLGEAAFGGRDKVLPSEMRVGSAIAILVYVLIIFVVRARAGLRSPNFIWAPVLVVST